MTPNDGNSFFPELEGEVRKEADLWLMEYVTLVIRIALRAKRVGPPSYPQPPVDESIGTGRIGTRSRPRGPTGAL